MRNARLKNPLLVDTVDVELQAVEQEEGPELKLEQAIKKIQLDMPPETREEKLIRICSQNRLDRVILLWSGFIVVVNVISCALAMLLSSSGVLEFLFTLSLIHGPFVLYQRLALIRSRSKREPAVTLWREAVLLKQANMEVETKLSSMRKDELRLESTLSPYKKMEGYDNYREYTKIKEEQRRLAEAIGLQKMLTSIMRCDGDSDHCVGNSELEILAHRLDLIEGVPFTSQEMCHQFGLKDDQSLLKLADVFLTLYIKKRREQVAANAKEGPRLGHSFIWKCEIDRLGVIS